MKAILIATGYNAALEPLMQHRCTPLLKIVDKYTIVHVIEYLVKEGIKQFHIILHHFPHLVEKAIGEGDRWGIEVVYYLAKDPNFPFNSIKPAASTWGSEMVLLAEADTLPKFDKHPFRNYRSESILFFYPSKQWTGWGTMEASLFKQLPYNTAKSDFLNKADLHCKTLKAFPFITSGSFQEIIQSNIRFITQTNHTGIYPSGAHMVEPDVWISHSVAIHPGIVIHPPIFIGSNCQIQEEVELGPNVIIERNCIVGKKSLIENSLICQRSLVGEELNISNSLVDRNLLINLSHDSILYIRDDFILSSLTGPRWITYSLRWADRFFGLLSFILLFPFFLIMLISCNLKKTPQLLLPAQDPSTWKTFDWFQFVPRKKRTSNRFENIFARLPVLLNIMLGQVSFVGVAPRTVEEVRNLPTDWQKLYLKCRVGLISLDSLEFGPTVSSEDRYAAEAYYAANRSPLFNLKVFFRWLMQKIFRGDPQL